MSNQETPETPPQPAQDVTQAPTPQQPDPRQGQRPSRPLKDTHTAYGKKIGRPRKDTAAEPAKPQNGSEPFKRIEWETFCRTVANGETQTEAYRVAKGKRIKYHTAGVRAAEWMRRPDFAARIAFLRLERAKAGFTGQITPETVERPARSVETPRANTPQRSQPITRDEVIEKLSTAIRGGDAQTVVAGIKALQAIMPELSVEPDNRPDPCAVIDYLTTFAARPGVEIVAELGGVPFILRRLRDTLRCDYADIRLGLEQVSRSTTKTHESQQTPTKTPDTQSGAAADTRT